MDTESEIESTKTNDPNNSVKETKEKDEEKHPSHNHKTSFGREIDLFIQHIDSLADSFPLTTMILQAANAGAYQEYKKFVDGNCTVKNENGKETVEVEPQNISEFNKRVKHANNSALAVKTVPRSLLVSLVSQFDSYLGGLLRVFFYRNPEMLNASDRALTLSQLVEFNSIENAREYILEKEIETVLRKSHSEQFEWLEKKFGLPLRKDLPSWPAFIELTERRNLFVHANGIVSSQYLKVSRVHRVPVDDDLKVGDELDVAPHYFNRAYRCVYEIGVKLAQVLWRKQYPDEIGDADKHLNGVTYELLREAKNNLAITLLDFATLTLKKHSTEENRRIAVINRAQAYKWIGDSAKAVEIVDSEDWSATSAEFKLAAAVLKDDFKTATELMTSVGSNGSPRKQDYKEWPLFKEFRESATFLETFKEVFGEPFKLAASERGEAPPEPPNEPSDGDVTPEPEPGLVN